ncbi:family 10 glycosylhydrolase [Rubricoccus marinus]|uniref:Glycosyl hydrolase-like 10 domain-containing protein n=1 Tax=Rubricoccus marinus TaxID=716817 RepID=A0A259U0N8_9BACT|nr:family 10 glycosylhydrolase [Rubricoccus marinus]OZC03506.1 hypothetical protein BSZ36_11245 [Rubricoccus marinus]
MRALSLFLLAALIAGGTTAEAQSLVTPVGPKQEFRGAWIATVINLDWPNSRNGSTFGQQAELRSMLDQLQASGVNAVMFQVRAESDALYQSDLEPWSYWLTGEQGVAPDPYYDPLEFVIEEAHARGMELHAWLNPYRADRGSSYPKADNHVTNTNPEWLLEFGDIKIYNPGLQAARDRMATVVADIVRRYDVDGMHIDDYFYPYPPNNISNQDADTFQADPRGFVSIGDWRRDNVNLMVAQVQDSINALKPEVKWGVSPFGIWKNGVPSGISGLDAYNTIYADAVSWMDNETVDYLAPQTYWAFGGGQDFGRLAPWWGEQRNDRHVYPGLGLYRSDNNTYSGARFQPNEIPRQIRLTREDENLQGHILFRAKNVSLYASQGFRDSLKTDLYRRAALTPTMAWKSLDAPGTPGPLASEWTGALDVTLTWSAPTDGAAETRRYAVYKILSEGEPNLAMALEDPANLVAVTGETTFVDRPNADALNWYYVVRAVSSNSIEGAPSNIVMIEGRDTASEAGPAPLASLLPPRPNPFSRETEVAFTLREPGRVTLRVMDVLGREVSVLVDDEPRAAGAQSVTWDARSNGAAVASGTYVIVLDADGDRQTRAVTVVR